MTEQEVAEYRFDMEGIAVRGKYVPRPIKSWVQCGVRQSVLQVCKKQRYDVPTPIQAQAIPVIMSGRDMMGIAKTGSGKTLAFVMPTIRHVLAQPRCEFGDGPIAVLMTPVNMEATGGLFIANGTTGASDFRVRVPAGGLAVRLRSRDQPATEALASVALK